LELSAEAIDPRYNKVQVQPDKVQELLIKRGVKAIPRKSAEIVLDLDATDDPLHFARKARILTVTIVITATCRCTAFAGTFRF
jgi:hypothetical protein